VPQANQREAEQLYGQQQLFMNDLNATTSEQAGAQHEAAVDRTREPARDPHQK
jgi:hypothetical protein